MWLNTRLGPQLGPNLLYFTVFHLASQKVFVFLDISHWFNQRGVLLGKNNSLNSKS